MLETWNLQRRLIITEKKKKKIGYKNDILGDLKSGDMPHNHEICAQTPWSIWVTTPICVKYFTISCFYYNIFEEFFS